MKTERTVSVDLTKEQCNVLAEFVDLYLLDVIRKDDDIDNLDWVRNMIDARDVLNEAGAP